MFSCCNAVDGTRDIGWGGTTPTINLEPREKWTILHGWAAMQKGNTPANGVPT